MTERQLDIEKRVKEHYVEALEYFPERSIVGLFLQGSQNYGLDTPNSDIDTKLIVVPSFKDIALAKPLVSTTHVLDNNEHLDAKDIRSYMSCFRKQNLNFLEILFTDFAIINPIYFQEWSRLIAAREAIARMNPSRAVRSMKGVAMEKFHAMEHPYPTKLDLIEKYGHDGKQTHHLLRVEDYLEKYIAGESYKSCLHPTPEKVAHMMEYKRQEIPLDVARIEAAAALKHVEEMADAFCETHEDKEDETIRELLEDVSYNIMKIAVKQEI